ncbi:hypothetical protein AAFC00_002799 [Neodothiora populina]|uniref:Homeobox domain-containing protein n=1 Tax=Neodothiora populina TaxID=2781224 RepID=A0ABR3P895_9PEZI
MDSTPVSVSDLHISTSAMESPDDYNQGTPSPNTPLTANGSSSRRPPRKSTLTQQQKNQKRQRATQDQLITLEHEFNKNPTPTALTRERIAEQINMTERSVQIWFQNRRAKIKNIARKSIENGEDCESIPESMRRHLAMQAMESGKGAFFPGLLGPNGSGYPYGSGTMSLNPEQGSGKVVIQHFACRSLSIGSWRRVGQSQMDLIIFYSPEKACVTYYINNDSAGYKIEYPFAWIKNINLVQGEVTTAAEGASQRMGSLIVELIRPPKFYMDSSGSGGFYECGDFTEDQQASSVMVHHLGGPSKALSGQLAKLVSLESFQNRHNLHDPSAFAPTSAPVTPIGFRPASQPNHLVHPHSAAFHDTGMGLMGPPAPRGHKRQRSRSVPAAIDFSMFRNQPMPSFLIQHEQAPVAQPLPENLFAPVPQHHHNNGFAPGPAGSNLSIDTSASYGMDFRQFGAPMSATTLNSPSEFGTPGFYNPAANADLLNVSTPYSSSFLSVDPSAMIGTSNTPVSVMSHGDPVIADQSPPLNGLGRNQNDDIFSTPGEHHLNEDALCLSSDMYTKSFGMPFHSPGLQDESFDFTSPAPANMKMNLPFRSQDQHQTPMYQSSPHPGHQQVMHQDSAIAFQSPTQMPHGGDNGQSLYQTPKAEGSMMYHSPAQMHDNHFTSPHDSSMYQSPSVQAGGNHNADEIDLNSFLHYNGTIDPSSL